MNGGAVSWCSCKQSVVAGSTCEAEYMAASEAAHEAIWVKEFITDLGVIPNASNSSVKTLELLPFPRSPGFTGRPGISSVASTPFVKVFKMET